MQLNIFLRILNIYGSLTIVKTNICRDKFALNSYFRGLVLSRKSTKIGIPRIIMHSQNVEFYAIARGKYFDICIFNTILNL
jgi:hypothetical protein